MDVVHAAYLHVHGLESAATVLQALVAVRSLYIVFDINRLMLELGLILVFGIGGAWMYFSTPRLRETVFGYLLLIAVIGVILALVTEQGPNSHY